MTSSDILQWDDTVAVDEGIEEYEYRRYPPNAGGVAMLNETGEIRFSIESGDIFTHPHRSYLQFEGRLTKKDGTPFADSAGGDVAEGRGVAFANNALMYLFNQIRYDIGEQEIETILSPGQATTMLGTLEYVDDFEVSRGLSLCWFKDAYTYDQNGAEQGGPTFNNPGFKARQNFIIAKYQKDAANRGKFVFNVPLSHIFGFCKDYEKVLYGVKQELTLTRKTDDEAIYRTNEDDLDAKITLNNLYWFVPIVKPSISNLNTLMNEMAENINIKVAFDERQVFSVGLPVGGTSYIWNITTKSANEKPRFLVVAFQSGRRTAQTADPSTFNHLNTSEMHVLLNNVKRYPALDFKMNFDAGDFMDAFNAAANYNCLVSGVPSCVSNFGINPISFEKLYPMFVFDISKQSATLKTAITNITVDMKFSKEIPANTFAYGVLLSDKVFNFQSDGKEVRPVF